MARKKSVNDINAQAKRISSNLIRVGYGGASARYRRMSEAHARYVNNIGNHQTQGMGVYGITDSSKKFSRTTYMGTKSKGVVAG